MAKQEENRGEMLRRGNNTHLAAIYENFIVKSNELARHGKYKLTAQQQLLLGFMISRVKPEDDINAIFSIRIKDYFDISYTSGDSNKNVDDLKNNLQAIADKSVWLDLPGHKGKKILLRWLDRVEIDTVEGVINYTFHKDMTTHLFNLEVRKTMYKLKDYAALKGKYARRLYDFLISYARLDKYHSLVVPLDELKSVLMAENYTTFKDFRRRVLDCSIEEINEKTLLFVSYQQPEREGAKREYKNITFVLREVSHPAEIMARTKEQRKELGIIKWYDD